MATTVNFTYSATSVTVDAPTYPEEPGDALQQAVAQSMSGRVMSVTRKAGTITSTVLHFRLTEAQYNNLRGFFYTTVSGATLDFTYTDHESTAWTATYLGGLPGAQLDYDDWAVDLRLRLVV
jgi:hypothetical protein